MFSTLRLAARLALLLFVASTALAQTGTMQLSSPDGQLLVRAWLDEQQRPAFSVSCREVVVASGRLGLEFAGSGPLDSGFEIVGKQHNSSDATYSISVGKASHARDLHSELLISLSERRKPYRRLELAFRAFDDGVAFRYQIPDQKPLDRFVLVDELTRLNFPGNPSATILPLKRHTTPYEAYYQRRTLPEIEVTDRPLVGLPMLMQHPSGLWIALTEAGLADYAGMYLTRQTPNAEFLDVSLSPLPEDVRPADPAAGVAKVVGQAPFASPWRVLMVADDPGRLIESNLVFHLNPSSKIEDTSWIKPGKTTFPWWNGYVLENVDFAAGVNTETMKHYIDFCSEQGIPYHTLDGLDIAWYGGPIQPDGPTDVTTAAPSIDMPELLRYAKSKDVRLRLWMHWKALQPQLDEAFATYEMWGIEGVMIDFMNRDDQEMVRWYHKVAQKAAEHHLTVTWHGACKPTGMERTWPNVLSYEAVLNQEFNKWRGRPPHGTPPKHNLDVAFVRMLAGPLDYHQGGMRNVLPEDYHFRNSAPPVQGTRGHQLAMYIVYQNHLPMMADYPAAYRGQPELPFLVAIPATWDETRVVHAHAGECLVIARRSGRDWYIGGMTAGRPQTLQLPLEFLGTGSFDVELFRDDPDAGPTVTAYELQKVSSQDTLRVPMRAAGGFAARLSPVAHD